ncbi:tetratricopeptide repeat protein [Herpetosiphon llansteffanensis]
MSDDQIWTAKSIQTLIQRPERLLADQTWRQRLQAFGGLGDFYHWLGQLPLEQPQQSLLKVLTTYPGAPVDSYCQMLNIHQATYHRYQKALFEQLAKLLNQPHQPRSDDPNSIADRAPIHQLRPAVGDFVGREPEFKRLTQAIQIAHTAKRGAALVGIHGMGGIGKSELSLIVAQNIVHLYPDAQLMLNMYGAREHALSTEQALGLVINALDPKTRLPEKREQLLARYHNILHNKQVLIVVDDARDAEHVRDLIPPVGCCLIITSRQRFSLPAMASVQLEALNAEESSNLIQEICSRLDRTSAEQMASACNYLPLALRVSASILQNNPALKLEHYLAQLTDENQRLQALRDPDDQQLNVEASLALSYAQLSAQQQYFLRQLAVLVADFSSSLGLTMLDLPNNLEAENQIYYLLRHNLLQYNSHSERWSMHDLIRSFALRQLAEQQETEAALWRYCEAIRNVCQTLYALYLNEIGGKLRAAQTFDREAEHVNWVFQYAPTQLGTDRGDQLMADLVLDTVYNRSNYYPSRVYRIEYINHAIEAATRLNNEPLLARILGHQANLYREFGKTREAIPILVRSIELAENHGITDHTTSYIQLAYCYQQLGTPDDLKMALSYAISAFLCNDQESELLKAYNNVPLINSIATIYVKLKNVELALYYYLKAVNIGITTNIGKDMSLHYGNIGNIYRRMGKVDKALEFIKKSAEIAEQYDDVISKAAAAVNLAEILADQAQYAESLAYFEQAIRFFTQVNYQFHVAYCQWYYGIALLWLDKFERAIAQYTLSIAYFQQQQTINQDNLALFEQLKAGQIEPRQFLAKVKPIT